MFHTLDELKDQEKAKKERKKTADFFVGGKSSGLVVENVEDRADKKRRIDNSVQFEKTKHKVKVAMYKNGFFLNDGKFRDKSIPENQKFMEEVEHGNIPEELIKKGYTDLGILLENHRSETFVGVDTKYHKSVYYPVNYGILPQNPYGIPMPYYNQYPFLSNPGYPYQSQYVGNRIMMYNTQTEQPPMLKAPRIDGHRQASVELKSKRQEDTIMKVATKKKNERPKTEKEKEKEKAEESKPKFVPFSGKGKLISNIDISGLKVNQNVSTNYDGYSPCCLIEIRLFNGTVLNASFSYNQTLRDVYFFVRNASGSNNFTLITGFPPRMLKEYDISVGNLGLHKSLITQRIN